MVSQARKQKNPRSRMAGEWATIHHGQLPEITNERTTHRLYEEKNQLSCI